MGVLRRRCWWFVCSSEWLFGSRLVLPSLFDRPHILTWNVIEPPFDINPLEEHLFIVISHCRGGGALDDVEGSANVLVCHHVREGTNLLGGLDTTVEERVGAHLLRGWLGRGESGGE